MVLVKITVTRILRNEFNNLRIQLKTLMFYFDQETVLTPALLGATLARRALSFVGELWCCGSSTPQPEGPLWRAARRFVAGPNITLPQSCGTVYLFSVPWCHGGAVVGCNGPAPLVSG